MDFNNLRPTKTLSRSTLNIIAKTISNRDIPEKEDNFYTIQNAWSFKQTRGSTGPKCFEKYLSSSFLNLKVNQKRQDNCNQTVTQTQAIE